MSRKKKLPADQKYPSIVYKDGGPHAGPEGHTYDFRPVHTEDELRHLLDSGWSLSLAEACGLAESEYDDGEVADSVVQPDPDGRAESPAAGRVFEGGSIAADAPLTRKELEAKAKELGIEVTKGMAHGLLEQKIVEALNIAEAGRVTGASKKV